MAIGEAFGAPGMEPRWTSSSKEGIGTAYHTASRIWFTLSHGVVNEIYFPCIDQPNTRDVQLLISDGETFVHEERKDLQTEMRYPEKNVLAYEIENKDKEGRYTICKTVICDPHLPVLAINHQLKVHDENLRGKLKVYLLIAPHLRGQGWGNHAHVIDRHGSHILHAEREKLHLVCGAQPAFGTASAGFVGASDGFQDLIKHHKMEWAFEKAENGNVALTAEILPDENGRFFVSIGFGESISSALTAMEQTLARPFQKVFFRYVKQWRRMGHHHGEDPEHYRQTSDGGSLYRLSRCVLQAHEDKLYHGSLIASLSIPWGDAKNDDDLGGYHLVWPRDVLHSASAMLVSGQTDLPLRTLIYFSCIQREDGSMPQNCWIDGTEYWQGRQLDETAAPVLLARRLANVGALQEFDPWVTATRAVAHLMLCGPWTGQERWEEASGYSPSTIAEILAAVVSLSIFAKERGEEKTQAFLWEYADWLHGNLAAWLCTKKGTLDEEIPCHFVRIVPQAEDLSGPAGNPEDLSFQIANGGGTHRASDIVDGGFLNLVRYGFLAPDDPLVVDSLKLIDRELKVDFAEGSCWRRYQFDGYGSQIDGSAFDGTGYGGCWPLLTGERGHYELAAGRDPQPFLRAMENFANEGGMFPEQIWPLADVGNLKRGKPAGSAMPLCWAHAEYISLVHSCHQGFPVDRLEEAWERYVENPAPEVKTVFWSLAHRTPKISTKNRLCLLLDSEKRVHWRAEGEGFASKAAEHFFANLHVVDLGTLEHTIEFSLDGRDEWFRIEVE